MQKDGFKRFTFLDVQIGITYKIMFGRKISI